MRITQVLGVSIIASMLCIFDAYASSASYSFVIIDQEEDLIHPEASANDLNFGGLFAQINGLGADQDSHIAVSRPLSRRVSIFSNGDSLPLVHSYILSKGNGNTSLMGESAYIEDIAEAGSHSLAASEAEKVLEVAEQIEPIEVVEVPQVGRVEVKKVTVTTYPKEQYIVFKNCSSIDIIKLHEPLPPTPVTVAAVEPATITSATTYTVGDIYPLLTTSPAYLDTSAFVSHATLRQKLNGQSQWLYTSQAGVSAKNEQAKVATSFTHLTSRLAHLNLLEAGLIVKPWYVGMGLGKWKLGEKGTVKDFHYGFSWKKQLQNSKLKVRATVKHTKFDGQRVIHALIPDVAIAFNTHFGTVSARAAQVISKKPVTTFFCGLSIGDKIRKFEVELGKAIGRKYAHSSIKLKFRLHL